MFATKRCQKVKLKFLGYTREEPESKYPAKQVQWLCGVLLYAKMFAMPEGVEGRKREVLENSIDSFMYINYNINKYK